MYMGMGYLSYSGQFVERRAREGEKGGRGPTSKARET